MMIVSPDANVAVFTVLHISRQFDITFYAEEDFFTVSHLILRGVVLFALSFFQCALSTFSFFQWFCFTWFFVGRLYCCILHFFFFMPFFHMTFIVNLIRVSFHSRITAYSMEQRHQIYRDQRKVWQAPHRMSFVNWAHHDPQIAHTENCEGEKTYRERPWWTNLEKWPFSFLVAWAKEAGIVPNPLKPWGISTNSLWINYRKLNLVLLWRTFDFKQAFFIFVFH